MAGLLVALAAGPEDNSVSRGGKKVNLKELLFGGGVKDGGSGQGAYRDSIQAWLPIKNIIGGVAVTKDNRFIKILEVLPVNIYLKSAGDRQTIISAYAAYLKNCAGQPSDGGTDHPGGHRRICGTDAAVCRTGGKRRMPRDDRG